MKGYGCVWTWLRFDPPKELPCVLLVSDLPEITDALPYALLGESAETGAQGQLCALEVARGA